MNNYYNKYLKYKTKYIGGSHTKQSDQDRKKEREDRGKVWREKNAMEKVVVEELKQVELSEEKKMREFKNFLKVNVVPYFSFPTEIKEPVAFKFNAVWVAKLYLEELKKLFPNINSTIVKEKLIKKWIPAHYETKFTMQHDNSDSEEEGEGEGEEEDDSWLLTPYQNHIKYDCSCKCSNKSYKRRKHQRGECPCKVCNDIILSEEKLLEPKGYKRTIEADYPMDTIWLFIIPTSAGVSTDDTRKFLHSARDYGAHLRDESSFGINIMDNKHLITYSGYNSKLHQDWIPSPKKIIKLDFNYHESIKKYHINFENIHSQIWSLHKNDILHFLKDLGLSNDLIKIILSYKSI
jgi:hypothetical protein